MRTSLHWPSVRGRARADAGPLALVAAVVAVVALLAGATPPLIRSTSDAATRDTVRRSADDAAVRVEADWGDNYGPTGGRLREPRLAEDVAGLAAFAEVDLDPSLRSVLLPPVTTVSSISMMITDGSVQRRLQLEYLYETSGGPAVTWIAGTAPRASTSNDSVEIPLNGTPWPVQVGLTENEATALGVRPGSRIPVQDEQRTKYDVRVSGIFRPTDPNDPAWRLAPWVLRPVTDTDGLGSTRLGGLLSPDSLPDARLAFRSDQLRRTVRFDADPDTLTWKTAEALAAKVAALKAGSAVSAERAGALKWTTQLDSLLSDLRQQIATATAQASVLLIAVLAGALLVVGLGADLLTRRRRTALTTARQRGAALPAIATELTIESLAVAGPAALIGLALSVVLTGGAGLTWVLPFLVVAVGAGPAYGTLAAARATRDRRTPANRSARRWIRQTGLIRRTAVDAAVLILAAASLIALYQRGVDDTTLPAAGPTLGVLAVSLLVVRLLPRATQLALRLALRSKRPLVLFVAARAAATSARVLPALALTASIALASFAVTLSATTERGLSDGAWQTVGADAQLVLPSNSGNSTVEITRRIAAAPGVTHAVAAQVVENAQFIVESTAYPARLIVVDTAAYRQLLADTPLPTWPAASAPATDGIPALVLAGDNSLRPGLRFSLPQPDHRPVELTAVGRAPAVGGGDNLVVVDAAAGLPFVPNTVWVTGPGAAAAARNTHVDARVTTLADVLEQRRTAPLTAGLSHLYVIAAVTLLALGLLGFALAAAASAPERWETLARLRTLGLRPRDTQRVAAGELLPVLLVAALCGPVLGALFGRLTLGPLALRVLTEQATDPVPVVPWWTAELVTLAASAAVLVLVVAAETAARRRRRLGDVLRVGAGW